MAEQPKIKYERLIEICDEKRRAYDRACGSYDTTLNRIKTEFGCDTIDAAKALLEKMQRGTDKKRAAYETELAKFMEAYPDVR